MALRLRLALLSLLQEQRDYMQQSPRCSVNMREQQKINKYIYRGYIYVAIKTINIYIEDIYMSIIVQLCKEGAMKYTLYTL